jgi:HAD superfamily hydrolase (TIGR01549 family)
VNGGTITRVPLAIFDLDNTLVDRTGPFRRWAAEFVADRGLDPAELRWLVAADDDGFAPRLGFMSAVRDRYRIDESPDALLDRFRNRMIAHLEPDPEVPSMLDRLRADGWRVAIATNGEVPQQQAKIDRAGLAGSVDAVAISQEVGVAKPDPHIFEVAARRCGARLADGGWMVGDCPTRDIAGGRGAGLRTIWLRHGRRWEPAAPAPDAIVDTIREVATALARAPQSR